MHSSIGNTVHSTPLNNLEHCICTTTSRASTCNITHQSAESDALALPPLRAAFLQSYNLPPNTALSQPVFPFSRHPAAAGIRSWNQGRDYSGRARRGRGGRLPLSGRPRVPRSRCTCKLGQREPVPTAPSKHETFKQCWFNVGPLLNQHCLNASCLLGGGGGGRPR